MIGVDDIISLPKGQAFILINGGELFKIRVPIPTNPQEYSISPFSKIISY